jgi:hypothetical protein
MVGERTWAPRTPGPPKLWSSHPGILPLASIPQHRHERHRDGLNRRTRVVWGRSVPLFRSDAGAPTHAADQRSIPVVPVRLIKDIVLAAYCPRLLPVFGDCLARFLVQGETFLMELTPFHVKHSDGRTGPLKSSLAKNGMFAAAQRLV